MKTKTVLYVLALIIVCASCQRYDSENDFRITYGDGGKSATITGYVGGKQTVSIPPRIQKMPVTGIGQEAFKEKEIISVTLPKSVTFIGESAFANNPLISIKILKGITEIGNRAFDWCFLTSITIPAGVTEIGKEAFSNCLSLTSINVDRKNPNYASEDGILYNKAKTEIIYVPLKLSGNVTIPASVTAIGDRAFGSRTSLTAITVPAGVTSIGSSVFSGCTNLASITIPAGVTSIGNEAFYYCASLTGITIPAGVMSIGNFVFTGCISLTSITVDENNPNYASEGGILYNKAKTVIVAVPEGISGAVTIPASVTTIGDYAFSSCTSLNSITIPASVTSIGDYAFSDCTGLTSINVDSGNPRYASEGAILYNKAKTTLIKAPQGISGAVTIPASVRSIGDYAFSGCTSLTSITIPAGVTSVNNWVFSGWTSSQTIYVQGHASQAAANRAWMNDLSRDDCNARIIYQGGR